MAGAAPANGNGVARLGVYASVALAVLTVAGVFITIGNVSNQVTQNSAEITSLKARLAMSEASVRALQIREAEGRRNDCQTFARIEVQFGTVETIINEIHVSQIRDHGALWAKIFNEQQPPIYYAIAIPHDILPC